MTQSHFLRFFATFSLLIASHVQADNLTDKDFIDCRVLTGEKKQAPYKTFVDELTQAAAKGDVESGFNLASLMNNRFVCLEKAHLGKTRWTMTRETPGTQEVETVYRQPTLKNLTQYPEAYAALQDAIAAYQRIAESSLPARLILGTYYADYNDVLGKKEDGYFYLASAYEAECGAAQANTKKNERCTPLKEKKMLYQPLLSGTEREALDQKAKDWAKQYMAKSTTR